MISERNNLENLFIAGHLQSQRSHATREVPESEVLSEDELRRRERIRRLSVVRHAHKVEQYDLSETAKTRHDGAVSMGACAKIASAWNDFYVPKDLAVLFWWDIFIVALLLYSCTVEIYLSTFRKESPSAWNTVRQRTLLVCFLFDMSLECVTCYVANGFVEVVDKSYITWRYLFSDSAVRSKEPRLSIGWFWVDLLSVIPWQNILHFSHWGRLLALLKALRIMRVQTTLDTMTSTNTRVQSGYMRLLIYSITIFLISHVLGCVFFILPAIAEEMSWDDGLQRAGVSSWIEDQGLDKNGTKEHVPWVFAFYWAITTMTTIGFGDVTPVSTPEVVITIVGEILGMVTFTVLVSKLTSILDFFSRKKNESRERIDRLIDFMNMHDVPHSLRGRIVDYVDSSSKSNRTHQELDASDERVLSVELKRQLRVALKLPALVQTYPFNSLSEVLPTIRSAPALLKEIAYMMQSDAKAPEDVIVKRGQFGEKLNIILHGTATVFTALGKVGGPITQVEEDDMEGLIEMETVTSAGASHRQRMWGRVKRGTFSLFDPEHHRKNREENDATLLKSVKSFRLKNCLKVSIDRRVNRISMCSLDEETRVFWAVAEGEASLKSENDKWYEAISESMSGTRQKMQQVVRNTHEALHSHEALIGSIALEMDLDPSEIRVVGIVGSTKFHNAASRNICKVLGEKLATLDENYVLLTGGFSGAGETVARSFEAARKRLGKCPGQFNVLPVTDPELQEKFLGLAPTRTRAADGQLTFGSCRYGMTFHMGDTVKEREELMAVSPCLIVIEGGPGAANEVTKAKTMGKIGVPVGVTGGAAAGLFGCNHDDVPNGVSTSEWEAIIDPQGDTDAAVVAARITNCVESVFEGLKSSGLDASQKYLEAVASQMQKLDSLQKLSAGLCKMEQEYVKRDEHDGKILFPIHTVEGDGMVMTNNGQDSSSEPTYVKSSTRSPSVILGAGGAISFDPLPNLGSYKRTIWIGRLSTRVSNAAFLREHFKRFGEVDAVYLRCKQRVEVWDDTDWALVTFVDATSAWIASTADMRELGNNSVATMARKGVRAQAHPLARWAHLEVRASTYCELLYCSTKELRSKMTQFYTEGASLERMLLKCPEFVWDAPDLGDEAPLPAMTTFQAELHQKDSKETVSTRVSKVEQSVKRLEKKMDKNMSTLQSQLANITRLLSGKPGSQTSVGGEAVCTLAEQPCAQPEAQQQALGPSRVGSPTVTLLPVNETVAGSRRAHDSDESGAVPRTTAKSDGRREKSHTPEGRRSASSPDAEIRRNADRVGRQTPEPQVVPKAGRLTPEKTRPKSPTPPAELDPTGASKRSTSSPFKSPRY